MRMKSSYLRGPILLASHRPLRPRCLRTLPNPKLAFAVLAVGIAGIDISDTEIERVLSAAMPGSSP